MKIYISADMEGISGVTHRDEVDPSNSREYPRSCELMTSEVLAACEGALEAGATEIWVKDAHWNARNLHTDKLPKEVQVIRGWSGHPYMMVEQLNNSFTAVAMIGYHSKASSGGNPLAHTLTGKFSAIRFNGKPVSEFQIHSYAALLEKVPTVFVSGDETLCEEARQLNEGIETVSTMTGMGAANRCLHPKTAQEKIKAGIRKVLQSELGRFSKTLPSTFEVEIGFKSAADAYKNSFFPKAALKDAHTVILKTEQYFDVLTFLSICSAF